MPPRNRCRVRKSSPKLNNFPNFNKLPLEIRFKIWQYTLQPQNVAIAQDNDRPWEFQYHFNHTPFPVALHVCQESRNELLRQYTCLSLTPTHYRQPLSPPCRYVNFAIDTFIFPNLEYGLQPSFVAIGEQSQGIQSIVVGTDMYGDIGYNDVELLSKLPHLNSLRIHLGGIGVYKEILVFDPTVEHELLLDRAPESYCWSSLLGAFQRRIAKHWSGGLIPWKGFSSMDNFREPRYIHEKSFYVGEFRKWMKIE
jgi:hypothetical protein